MATGVELATAWVKLVPSADGIQGDLEKSLGPAADEAGEKAGKRAGGKFGTAAKVAITAASAAIVAGVVKVFQTGMEELKFGEQISAQTDVLIKNTGFAMKTSEIEDFTLSLSRLSGVSEEDLQDAGNSILKFGNISEENYQKAVSSINDLAASGKDAKGSAEALGKALADPATAASLLKRQGIQLNEEQQALIENFVAAGDKASAQGVILDALEGTYGGMAEQVGGTLTGSINRLQNSWENVAGVMVETLLPAVSGIVDALGGLFAFLEANPDVVTALAIAIGVLVVAIIAANIAMWALAANPIVLLITAIIVAVGLLIAGIWLLVANWDQVWAWVTATWEGFVSWLQGVWAGFSAWWISVWEGFGNWVKQVWEGFTGWLQAIWTGFTGWLMGVVNGLVSWWNGLWAGFGGVISDVWRNFTLGLRVLWNAFQSWLMGAISGFQSWWNGVWSAVGNFINGVWQGVGNVVRSVWDGIVGVIRGAVNGIIGYINGIIRTINNVSGAIAGVFGGEGLKIGTIPGLAGGGTVTHAGAVIVGENGPELLRLPAGASVDPDIGRAAEPGRTVIFKNYAPLGQSPAQALTQFANRAEVVL